MNDDGLRLLDAGDTEALRALVDADPVAHNFVDSQLIASGTADPCNGAYYVGRFEGEELVAAVWVGSNVVPVSFRREDGQAFGRFLLGQRRRYASVFGPSQAVLGVWDELRRGHQQALDVREHQPLMTLDGPPHLPAPHVVRRAWPLDFDRLLPACVAMFTEELGYSPLRHGQAAYRARIEELIRAGHSFVETDGDGAVQFKAELGVVTPRVTQIQGVWMTPRRRGKGLAASRMADVALHARQIAPVVSLYVNDYNERAVATYQRVGFQQVGEFATVLF